MRKSWMNHALLGAMAGLFCSSACVLACGDDDATIQPEQDGGPSGSDAGGPPPDGAPPADAADAFVECGPGHTATATVNPAGATVSLCGATLEIPTDALTAGTKVGIAVVEPPGAPWFDFQLSGPVFRFTPDDAALGAKAKIKLTRDKTKTRGPVLARWLPGEKEWAEHEGCPEDDVLSLETNRLGTFGLMQDVDTYPEVLSGLGQANLTVTIGGQQTSWTVPGSEGYAVHEVSPESRSLMIVARRYEGEYLQSFDLRIFVPKSGPPVLVQASWLSTEPDVHGWSFVEPVHGEPESFTLTETVPGTFSGELHATAYYGDETTPLEATFTTTTAKYRPPPSYSCGTVEGDRR